MLDNELFHRWRVVFKDNLSNQLSTAMESPLKNKLWHNTHRGAPRTIGRAAYESIHLALLEERELVYE